MRKVVIKTNRAPAPIGPYNQAIKAGGMLYVSGQITLDPKSGELVNNTIEVETDLVMRNLGEILKEAGSDYSEIVKCSIFIKDMDQFSAINAVYGKFFEENYPARETVEVGRLPKDVNVEISCIALVKD